MTKVVFFLSIVAGILIVLSAVLVLAFPITDARSLALKYYAGVNISQPPLVFIIASIVSGLIIIFGATKLIGESKKTAAKLILLFSIINVFVIGVGNAISAVGSIIGIISGIIALVEKQNSKVNQTI